MQCPRDGAVLMEINKSGVQIDVCPECRGMWLDRGELEKIIQVTRDLEREFAHPPQAAGHALRPEPVRERPSKYVQEPREYRRDDERKRGWHDDDDDDRKRKHKSGLSKLLDIFD